MSLDSVDDIEAAEDLLAALAAILRPALAPITVPIAETAQEWVPQETLDAFERTRLLVTTLEPLPSLERMLDRIESYCRPTCGADGGDHGRADSLCGCPCHDRPPQAVIDAALDAFRQPPDA